MNGPLGVLKGIGMHHGAKCGGFPCHDSLARLLWLYHRLMFEPEVLERSIVNACYLNGYEASFQGEGSPTA